MDLNLSMFRAYDIRTPSERLTPDLAARLADAIGVYFKEEIGTGGVVIAEPEAEPEAENDDEGDDDGDTGGGGEAGLAGDQGELS